MTVADKDETGFGLGPGVNGGRPVFSLRHRALRAAWAVVWGALGAWTPPPLHAWRRFLLTLFGAKIAPTAAVYGSAKIWYPPNLVMKDGAVLGWQTFVYSQDLITIGENAVVSQWSRLITGTHDFDSAGFELYTKPIVIGAHAWIAGAAMVGPGVTIGEGSVLGAGGVTFRDLEPWSVYAGNPAVRIKARNRFIDPATGIM